MPTLFDRSKLRVQTIRERRNLVSHEDVRDPLKTKIPKLKADVLGNVMLLATMIKGARGQGKPVIFFMGGHPIKLGLQRYLVDLMNQGYVTSVAGTGATLLHDFEMAWFGSTSEPVEEYLPEGQFGLWDSTQVLNGVLNDTPGCLCLGDEVGRWLSTHSAFYDVSLLANAYKNDVPFTIHPHLGADIWQMADPFKAEKVACLADNDFLAFTHQVSCLDGGGVFVNIGSQVAGPELFLKSLSMVRNVAKQNGESVGKFTTAVLDWNVPDSVEVFQSNRPEYYKRTWKTILHRAVMPDGKGFGIPGDFSDTIPNLWAAIVGTVEKRV
jgi:hypothetical protein